MSGDQIFWICLAGIIGVTVIAGIPLVGLFWRKIIRDLKSVELKLAMVERGYSAEEIERIVRAGEPDAPAAAPTPDKIELAGQPVS